MGDGETESVGDGQCGMERVWGGRKRERVGWRERECGWERQRVWKGENVWDRERELCNVINCVILQRLTDICTIIPQPPTSDLFVGIVFYSIYRPTAMPSSYLWILEGFVASEIFFSYFFSYFFFFKCVTTGSTHIPAAFLWFWFGGLRTRNMYAGRFRALRKQTKKQKPKKKERKKESATNK